MDDWEPLPLAEVVALMAPFPAPWWVSGGHALELYLGRSWREHDDVDVGIRRTDAPLLLELLAGHEIHVASAGVLTPWDGHDLSAERSENNLWVRLPGGRWELDVTVGAGDDSDWIYRRDPTLRLPWDVAVRRSADGIPFMAPAVQLLFKSTDVRPKDQLDAETVTPHLDTWSLALLDVRLPKGHPWRPLVDPRLCGTTADDVIEVLDLLAAADVDVVVDGGWAVDALVGEQTRRHRDLDLALPTRQWHTAIDALASHGFRLVRDDGPHNVVLLDARGRLVDLHSYDDATTVLGDDGIERHGPDGLAYLTGGFDGRGRIAAREVACICPDHLLRYHSGYELDDDDRHDIALLRRLLGAP